MLSISIMISFKSHTNNSFKRAEPVFKIWIQDPVFDQNSDVYFLVKYCMSFVFSTQFLLFCNKVPWSDPANLQCSVKWLYLKVLQFPIFCQFVWNRFVSGLFFSCFFFLLYQNWNVSWNFLVVNFHNFYWSSVFDIPGYFSSFFSKIFFRAKFLKLFLCSLNKFRPNE